MGSQILEANTKEDLLSSGALTSSCPDGHCVVPAGHTWILDQSIDVEPPVVFVVTRALVVMCVQVGSRFRDFV